MNYLKLPSLNGKYLKINYNNFRDIQNELEMFLDEEDYMNDRRFAKKVMFSHEIKSNNMVEGIMDDLFVIEKVIWDASSIRDEKQKKRIINLYNGYKYILTHKVMDSHHLRELYAILSEGLLENEDMVRMGDFYRKDKVFILKNGRLDMDLDEGIPFEMIDRYMDIYFDFVNRESLGNSLTEEFIKSQIMHFYLVYIHPYFDVNGRTSRTMAMWHLINQEAYPFIIFNRAITFEASKYDKAIMDTKEFWDISFFIKYMMVNVKRELEKEMVMRQIKDSTSMRLEAIDYQSIMYILSMNGEVNVLNFATTYRRFNDFKSVRQIYEEMIVPLKEKGVLEVIRNTNKMMFDDTFNEVLRINPNRYDRDNLKIKRLNLDNK